MQYYVPGRRPPEVAPRAVCRNPVVALIGGDPRFWGRRPKGKERDDGHPSGRRTPLHSPARRRQGRERIAMMTAYDAPTAALLDAAGVDVLLVGDSVEMTVYGEPNTLTATMDSMVRHTRAVSRAAKRAVVVGDMPFLSYQAETARAVENAGRFLAEGGVRRRQARRRPADPAGRRGDPRGGHPGDGPRRPDAAVVPQVRRLQGPGPRGRIRAADPRRRAGARAGGLLRDRARVRSRGARRGDHARDRDPDDRHRRRRLLRRPGARLPRRRGPDADLRPKFVRRYAELSSVIEEAARAFTQDVKSGAFPSKEESFTGVKPTLRRVH